VGIEAEGTAYRMDHVPLPLKKVVEPPFGVLSDEEILRRVLSEVRKLRRKRQLEAH
jgi:formylmethanofuran dehydrogenase subunit B